MRALLIRVRCSRHGKVISYQRRLNFIKSEFFTRGCATPLGELIDWWDRTDIRAPPKMELTHPFIARDNYRVNEPTRICTFPHMCSPAGVAVEPREEAQQRGALHSHILVWYAKRDIEKDFPMYQPLPALPRTAPGNDCRQRPRTQAVDDLDNYQEDNIYFHNKAKLVQQLAYALMPDRARCFAACYNAEPLRSHVSGRRWFVRTCITRRRRPGLDTIT